MRWLLAMLALIWVTLVVQSQEHPPEQKPKSATESQHVTQTQHRSTDYSPAASHVIISGDVNVKRTDRETESCGNKCYSLYTFFAEVKITDVLLALFTFFLMIYTARLFYATDNLARAEQPILVPLNFKLTGIRDFDVDKTEVDLWFDFQNVGRTPSYLTRLKFGVQHHSGDLPIGCPTSETKDIFVIVGPTKFLTPLKNQTAVVQIPIALKQAIIAKSTILYIFGTMDFEEISGTKHSQGFAVKFAPGETGIDDMMVNCGPRHYWTHS